MLVDIIEVFDGGYEQYSQVKVGIIVPRSEPKLVSHKFLIGCYTCDSTRMVEEETYWKMVGLGLIEQNDEVKT